MTNVEFERWLEFYRRYPFDDLHRYHRPAALVAGSLRGVNLNTLLDWLAGPRTPGIGGKFSAGDVATIAALGGVPPRKKR